MEDYFHTRVVDRAAGRRDRAPGSAPAAGRVTPHLIMARTREPDRRVDTSMIREVRVRRPDRGATRGRPSRSRWGDDEIAALLDEAKRLIVRAVPTRFFAAFARRRDRGVLRGAQRRRRRADRGREHARALPRPRARTRGRAARARRGCARRTTSSSSRRSRTTGRASSTRSSASTSSASGTSHAVPAPADAPARAHAAARAARSATVAELRALAELAQRGHPRPGEMPFEVAWTDDSGEPRFIRSSSATTTAAPRVGPERLALNLIAFHRRPPGRRPVAPRGALRATRRTVDTGSWLGRDLPGTGPRDGDARGGARARVRRARRRGRALGRDRRATRSRSASRASSATRSSARTWSARAASRRAHRPRAAARAVRSPVPVEVVALEPLLPLFGRHELARVRRDVRDALRDHRPDRERADLRRDHAQPDAAAAPARGRCAPCSRPAR